mmetsp:Transcript_110727/g.313257  ORF Transcript_110727/g.313257 Transcript_110727/m.313257 type:complete len:284 (-) Transcript_110727:52-903(-)
MARTAPGQVPMAPLKPDGTKTMFMALPRSLAAEIASQALRQAPPSSTKPCEQTRQVPSAAEQRLQCPPLPAHASPTTKAAPKPFAPGTGASRPFFPFWATAAAPAASSDAFPRLTDTVLAKRSPRDCVTSTTATFRSFLSFASFTQKRYSAFDAAPPARFATLAASGVPLFVAAPPMIGPSNSTAPASGPAPIRSRSSPTNVASAPSADAESSSRASRRACTALRSRPLCRSTSPVTHWPSSWLHDSGSAEAATMSHAAARRRPSATMAGGGSSVRRGPGTQV